MSSPITIIPAAGQSKRFVDGGYLRPKPFIRLQNEQGVSQHMISYVIDMIRNGLIIAAVPEQYKSYSHDQRAVYYPIQKTVGQADTVHQVLEMIGGSLMGRPVLVHDCDMLLEQEDIDELVKSIDFFDMAVAVTKTFDPNASRVDQIPNPTRYVEKEPISEWGIVGARIFKDGLKLKHALFQTLREACELGQEPYISQAMNHYPGTCYAHIVRRYKDFGTPERVRESGFTIVS